MIFPIVLVFVLFGFATCEVLDLSCDQIRAIVDTHNTHREELSKGEVEDQPAASNMKYMAWDDELAEKASTWASNGVFEHNPDKTIESGRFDTGENIYTYSTTDPDYKLDVVAGIEDWFNEHKDYTFDRLTNADFERPSETEIGHYTQMVWADSTYVGCGVDKRSKDDWTTYLLVCNYGPAGNMISEEPYKTGDGDMECGTDDCGKLYGSC